MDEEMDLQKTKGLISAIAELLPIDVLANMMVDRTTSGLDSWKYTAWIAEKYIELLGVQKRIEIVINGTKEIDVADWNEKVDGSNKGKMGIDQWSGLVSSVSMLTPEERDILLKLKAPVVEYLTTEIVKQGGSKE